MSRFRAAPVVSTPVTRAEARVVFLDFARAAATLMMLQGHTVDALLAPAHRTTIGFELLTFVRSLTPSTFLFVSGFSFTLVTLRNWAGRTSADATRRRLKRFAFFLALGYAMHYPATNLAGIPLVTTEGWQALFAADVLQCIALTLSLLQGLAVVSGSPRMLQRWCLAVAAMVCALTPMLWAGAPWRHVPDPLAAYLSPAHGSLFPLFPWLSLGMFGAAMGVMYAGVSAGTPGAAARRTLWPVGVGLLAVALLWRLFQWEPFGDTEIGPARPSQILLQAGLVCVLLTVFASLSDLRPRRVAALESLAQESLVVYFVHICLVYGSPWNDGLRQYFGATLSPLAVFACVLVLWTAMGAMSLGWTRWKREHRESAVRLRWATVAMLVLLLIF